MGSGPCLCLISVDSERRTAEQLPQDQTLLNLRIIHTTKDIFKKKSLLY
jgi:hypothetical protein